MLKNTLTFVQKPYWKYLEKKLNERKVIDTIKVKG